MFSKPLHNKVSIGWYVENVPQPMLKTAKEPADRQTFVTNHQFLDRLKLDCALLESLFDMT